ncbi:LOW QUALITY PROTEIN: tRNA pseudouridine synthase B, partial [Streptomyces sp. e14]
MTSKPTPPDGLVIVDKPSGFTSHDVVAKMRGIAKTRRVGHAGTLDPMATGVLVLGVERATKLLGHLALTEKEYVGTVRLGQNTLTDDAEGEITSSTDASEVTREAIDTAVAKLTGDIMQVPSKVSAIKINGVRSYKRAREGEEFEIPARPVTVSSFRVYDLRDAVADDGTPVLDLVVSVVCSSGTYIRALARDLGRRPRRRRSPHGAAPHPRRPVQAGRGQDAGPAPAGADRDAGRRGRRRGVPALGRRRTPRQAAHQRRPPGDARRVRGPRPRRRLHPRGPPPGPRRGAARQGQEPGRLRL